MEDITAASSSEDDHSDVESLSFSQRRAMRFKKKKKKPTRSRLLDTKSELSNLSEPVPTLTPITSNNMEQDVNENDEEKTETADFITKQQTNEYEEQEEYKHDAITQETAQDQINGCIEKKYDDIDENEPLVQSKKFDAVSNANELEIDPSDIMSEVELIKRKIENMLGDNQANNNKNVSKTKINNFKFSESYLETSSFKYIRLLSEKNLFDQDENEDFHIYNSNLIMDKSIIYRLQNEMMSVFTLIVGIVEGVTLLSLFVVINNTNAQFLQNFASLLYIIQFLSYIVVVLLIPYSCIILHYINNNNNEYNNKIITKYQTGLFVVCCAAMFICCMIEFPISDKIYYLYSQDNDYFSVEENINNTSSQVSKWKKLHIAKFCFLSIIWILCISFFRGTKSNEKKEE